MYQVIVVEDDPMVAEINKQLCERQNRLTVAGVFSDGNAALEHLRSHRTDLILLDYHLREMDGVSFLRTLRAEGRMEDVIMVTALDRTREITQVFSLGVLDYVIKPFRYERYLKALDRFVTKRETLSRQRSGTQATVDVVLGIRTAAAGLDTGLRRATLGNIRDYMESCAGEALSVAAISQHVGLSRPTVQKYIRYMLSAGMVVSACEPHPDGARRTNVYTYVGGVGE